MHKPYEVTIFCLFKILYISQRINIHIPPNFISKYPLKNSNCTLIINITDINVTNYNASFIKGILLNSKYLIESMINKIYAKY